MRGNFEKAYEIERRYEGGNVDHPKDPGGRTSRGVTQRVYDGYRRNHKLPVRDVFKASEQEVKDIYRQQYWDPVRGDALPDGIDLVVFDGAVNSGVAQSVKWLQRSVGVRADGQVGQATLGALQMSGDHVVSIINNICDQRMVFLKSLKTWGTFGRGWTARVSNLRQIANAWATESVPPQPSTAPQPAGGNQKADVKEVAEPIVNTETSAVATGSGVVITSTLTQLQQQLAPHAGTLKVIGYVCIAITAGLALYTIYSAVRARKIKEALAA